MSSFPVGLRCVLIFRVCDAGQNTLRRVQSLTEHLLRQLPSPRTVTRHDKVSFLQGDFPSFDGDDFVQILIHNYN